MAILENGDKVLIVHRRLYPSDMPRFFAGTVETFADGLALVAGYTWEREQFAGKFRRKDDMRKKIVPIASGTVLAYLLPRQTEVDRLVIETLGRDTVWLTDRGAFRMDLTERSSLAN
jgi:hypothetical protein